MQPTKNDIFYARALIRDARETLRLSQTGSMFFITNRKRLAREQLDMAALLLNVKG
jgi:hypothetical protein